MSAAITSCGVVIVNYASADLALAALASAWGARPLKGGTKIILVDNGSPDNSAARIVDVLSGRAPQPEMIPRPGVVYDLPTPDDVFFTTTRSGRVKAGGKKVPVTVVLSSENGGFAAGCNIGLRLVQAWGLDMAVLLNPDAVLTLGTIAAFADAFEADQRLGLAGATIRHFEPPFCVQAAGGASLSPWTLLGRNLMEGIPLEQVASGTATEVSYPHGAAMAVRAGFLKAAGLMNEDLFLYYEEADWVAAGGPAWRTKWVPGAAAFHHRGAVTKSHQGAGRRVAERSALSDYHMVRSRMIYAKKWRPKLLPFLNVLSLGQALRRVMRGQSSQSKAIMDAVFGWRKPTPDAYRPSSELATVEPPTCRTSALPNLSS